MFMQNLGDRDLKIPWKPTNLHHQTKHLLDWDDDDDDDDGDDSDEDDDYYEYDAPGSKST